MPQRKVILAVGETYHIFNRGIRHTPIFTNKREFNLFLMSMKYYLQSKPPCKFSIFRLQPHKYHLDFKDSLVKTIAYCLMPNHYHLILTQLKNNGIKNYIHRLATSYSHYFNQSHSQKGSLFEDKFKAVRIESQEQLTHLSRYLHLNPATSFLVENPLDYDYSSYKIYLKKEPPDFVNPEDIMFNFTPKSYEAFTLNQKDYQRELAALKHLTLE